MPPTHTARPFFGIGLKVLSTLAFTAMATLIKQASARYPVGELVFFRSFFALVPVLAWVGWRGELVTVFYTTRLGRHFVRSLTGAITMFFGFGALALLPIADATAIGYASPLMTVVLAVIFLGERVRIYRWTAVGVGLIGVLIILSDYVAPGSGPERNTFGALVAITGAFLGAVSTIQVRALVRYEGAGTIVIYFSAFTALVALVTVPFGWQVPTPLDATMLVAAGMLGGIGQVTMTQSFRHGDASLIAPFDYTSMIWSLAASWFVFNTWPSGIVLAGTAVVIAAGLFVIYREHRLGIERSRYKQAQTPSTPLS